MTEDDDDYLDALGGLLDEQDAEDERLQAALEAGEPVPDVDPALLEALRPLDAVELAGVQATVRPRSNVLPFRRFRVALAVPLAAAAAVLFFYLRPSPNALPAYELSVRSHGAQAWRSGTPAPAERPEFKVGTRFDFTLRPAARVDGEVELRARRVQGERRLPWAPALQRDPSGAFRVTGKVGPDLPPDPGDWTLVFEVARPGEPGQTFQVEIVVSP